ncbi:hypothetical protein G7067_04715 [Leucobacter insecticola]|uniref:Uncharacterized protein n=1 Tax=Leucobacter insecticola TaxID=2714934 RepID=A0A6G8FHP2_9MICO|nr:hypothetical protein [Leucobacter insecticola]QIM15877.1 hypothetical protein G7067_04715 [Leucobacter insecticola]
MAAKWATNSWATQKTYVLRPEDGAQSIRLKVFVSKPGYTTAPGWSVSVQVAGVFAPRVPVIAGIAEPGKTLTATPGMWGPAPVTMTYQWRVDNVPVSGATGATYVVKPVDLGKTITVVATAKKTGYVAATSTSAGRVVTLPLQAGSPKILGSLTVGSTLTADAGVWGPARLTLRICGSGTGCRFRARRSRRMW